MAVSLPPDAGHGGQDLPLHVLVPPALASNVSLGGNGTSTVTIGALMTNSTDQEFNDAGRIEVLEYAVDQFNLQNNSVRLDLDITVIERGSEPAGLVGAYDGGSGPLFYVGPTTSQGLENIMSGGASGPLLEDSVLLVSPSSEAPQLAVPGDNIFRTAVNIARQGDILVGEMEAAGIGSFVLVVRNDAWGTQLAEAINETAARRGIENTAQVLFDFERGNAPYWDGVAGRVAEGAAGAGAGAGVVFIGYDSSYASMAAAAAGIDALRQNTTWFSPSAAVDTSAPIADDAVRSFSAAVGLTTLSEDVDGNAITAAMAAALPDSGAAGGPPGFYEYSTYDAVHVLGSAIRAASEGGQNATVESVRGAIPAAAMDYSGALGDIILDENGDLLSPDTFTVWRVGADGSWERGATAGTPVVDIGALVVLEGNEFDDSDTLAAMRLAAEEYNREARGAGDAMYLDLETVRVSLSPGSATAASPSALDAIRTASERDGIRYYLGPSTSGNAERILEYANDNGLVLISPSSTAPSLAIEGDSLFRLVPNDRRQGVALADIIYGNQQGLLLAGLANESGVEHVVAVVRNDTWGRDLNASTSARFSQHGIGVTSIAHAEEGADWDAAASEISSAIAALRVQGPVAVLHIGFPGDFAALAARSGDYPDIGSVEWYGTDGVAGARAVAGDEALLRFASRVNLTATSFDVEGNARLDAVTRELGARGVQPETVYAYSAYDGVFVMAAAVKAAMSAAEGGEYSPADVRAMVRGAADAYDGALGDIKLNRAGDLRTPNSYAAWTIRDGAWERDRTYPATPVFDIGALLVLGGGPYSDDGERGAMEQAVEDFNEAHELIGDFYIDLEVQPISLTPGQSGSSAPDALAGLRAAHGGGSGPSLYVGPSTSANAGRILGYANDNDLFVISHSSSAQSLALDDGLFRLVPPSVLQAKAIADLIPTGGSVGAVTDLVLAVRNDTWGADLAAFAVRELGNQTAVTTTAVRFEPAGADWPAVAAALGGAIDDAAASAASRESGGGRAAVLFVGFPGDFAGLAGQARDVPSLASVSWFGTGGVARSPAVVSDAASLALARAVDLTAAVFSPVSNAINGRLDPDAVYGPSAYDAVYTMGRAIKAAYDGSGPDPPPAAAVRGAYVAANDGHAGALGHIVLDENGDLSSPDTYRVHRVGPAGSWNAIALLEEDTVDCDGGAYRCITIGEVYLQGFVPALEAHFAHELAVQDFNQMQPVPEDGSPRLHLEMRRAVITGQSPADGLAAAYANGTGISAFVGPATSSAALALKPFVDANDVVLVSMSSASVPRTLAEPDGLFRVSLNDRYEADLLVIAATRENVTTILPVVRDDPYGHSYDDEIRVEAALLGLAVLDPVLVPPGQRDLSEQVAEIGRRVAALNATTDLSTVGVFTAIFNFEMHNLAHYAVEDPSLASVTWFNPGTLWPPRPIADPETLEFARAFPLVSTSWEIAQSERLDRVHDIFREEFGHEPNQFSYAAYDSVLLLADAVARSARADGTYDAADVRANMHGAAERLDGLLGDDFRLDENGDRISPSRLVVWKTAPGTGAWEAIDRVQLDPRCSLTLGSPTIAFGAVAVGAPSAAMPQRLVATGTEPIDTVEISASAWTAGGAPPGAEALPAGATEVMAGGGGGGEWTPLSGSVTVGDAGGAPLQSPADVQLRLNMPPDASPSAGDIVQTVTYTASCPSPGN